jgi:hypothetical protein
VFFHNATDGFDYVCSATVVNSIAKNTVWTAGHCVNGGAGGTWHQNWTFVPAYSNGSAPYGQWTAYQLWSRTAWINNSDFNNDLGVALVNTLAGKHIVNKVGGQGITWNKSTRYFATDFGYPQAPPFDGETLKESQGNTFPNTVDTSAKNTIGLLSNMTGGSSGGAWLYNYATTGYGYIDGENSFKYNNDSDHMYSPYYGNNAADLYNTVSPR